MRSVRLMAGLVILAGTMLSAAEAQKLYTGTPVKVLLVTGGGFHDFKTQATIIPELIKARGDFQVDVIGPDWKAAQEMVEQGSFQRFRHQ